MFVRFETDFMAFSRSYFSTLEIFLCRSEVSLPNTGKNMCSPALKPVLQHLPFYF